MPDEFGIKAMGVLAVGIIGFFIRYHLARIDNELAKKANKEEVREVRQELRDAQANHAREVERIERTISERFASMERTFDSKLELLLQAIRRGQQ